MFNEYQWLSGRDQYISKEVLLEKLQEFGHSQNSALDWIRDETLPIRIYMSRYDAFGLQLRYC